MEMNNSLTQDQIRRRVTELGQWFHNLDAAGVVAIDTDEHYLDQARFAAKVSGADIEIRNLSVYRVSELREKFDLVLFMGVLYHLRHPLLALDLLHEFVVGDLLVAQSMLRGSTESIEVPADFPFWQSEPFENEEFPRMYFIEQRYANDPTNWWIPNRACFEAMLRSAGFEILDHPEDEVFICRHTTLSHPLKYTDELRELTR